LEEVITVRNRDLRGLGLGLTLCVLATAIAILNFATVSAQECPRDGGGRPSPSPSPSPTRSGGLPSLPLPTGDEETSASPSPSPGGGAAKCDSKITIAYKRNRFSGKVTSDNNRCAKGRSVKVKKVNAGTVGRTVTNQKGKWKVPEPDANGRYFAVTSKRKAGKIVCKAARSRKIRV
jgi:hypothetical protein